MKYFHCYHYLKRKRKQTTQLSFKAFHQFTTLKEIIMCIQLVIMHLIVGYSWFKCQFGFNDRRISHLVWLTISAVQTKAIIKIQLISLNKHVRLRIEVTPSSIALLVISMFSTETKELSSEHRWSSKCNSVFSEIAISL